MCRWLEHCLYKRIIRTASLVKRVTDAQSLLKDKESLSWWINSLRFMEPENTLPCTKKSATVPVLSWINQVLHQINQISSVHTIKTYLSELLPSTFRSRTRCLPFRFCNHNFYGLVFVPCYMSCLSPLKVSNRLEIIILHNSAQHDN